MGETFQYNALGQFYPLGEEEGKLYQRMQKGRKAWIEWMEPVEYFKRVSNRAIHTPADIFKRVNGRALVDKRRALAYAKLMKRGKKFPLPWIEYDDYGYTGQEGRHRVAAAMLAGARLVPVVIVESKKSYRDERGWYEHKLARAKNSSKK